MGTNATRQLDKLGVSYTIRNYEVELDDLSAPAVARKIAMPPCQVFKTLVARGDRIRVMLAVVAGDQELDLKALARVSENRKVELTPVDKLRDLTGYVRGG